MDTVKDCPICGAVVGEICLGRHGPCPGIAPQPRTYSTQAMQQDAPISVSVGRPIHLRGLPVAQGQPMEEEPLMEHLPEDAFDVPTSPPITVGTEFQKAKKTPFEKLIASQKPIEVKMGHVDIRTGRVFEAPSMFLQMPVGGATPGPVVPAYPDDNPKTVQGLRKVSLSTLPTGALFHMAKAMEDGKRKYGHMNWRDAKVTASTYLDAATRHHLSYLDGEDLAEDSLAHHLGHAMACYAIILDALECGMLNDDRPTRGPFARLVKESTKPLA